MAVTAPVGAGFVWVIAGCSVAVGALTVGVAGVIATRVTGAAGIWLEGATDRPSQALNAARTGGMLRPRMARTRMTAMAICQVRRAGR